MSTGKPGANLRDDQVQMVEDCENREGRLTDWERSFIDSLKSYMARGGFLSTKQEEHLTQVWEKATKNG